jgi:hypothetical protein
MLVSRQLTSRILVDAQRLRKESLELRHDCRNTRKYLATAEESTAGRKKVTPIRAAWHPLFDPKNRSKSTP